MPEAVIVDTVRTPIGRAFKGSLAQLRPDETGAFVLDRLVERNPDVDPKLIQEVFCGVGMPQGLQGFNLARIMVMLSENLGEETTGVTVSRYCASSLDAIRHASNAVKNGEGDAYIAAGVEFVSRYNGNDPKHDLTFLCYAALIVAVSLAMNHTVLAQFFTESVASAPYFAGNWESVR